MSPFVSNTESCSLVLMDLQQIFIPYVTNGISFIYPKWINTISKLWGTLSNFYSIQFFDKIHVVYSIVPDETAHSTFLSGAIQI